MQTLKPFQPALTFVRLFLTDVKRSEVDERINVVDLTLQLLEVLVLYVAIQLFAEDCNLLRGRSDLLDLAVNL